MAWSVVNSPPVWNHIGLRKKTQFLKSGQQQPLLSPKTLVHLQACAPAEAASVLAPLCTKLLFSQYDQRPFQEVPWWQ